MSPYKATYHPDTDGEHTDWVLRLSHEGSFAGIGAANNEEEAEIIVDAINALLAHDYGSDSEEEQRDIVSKLRLAAHNVAAYCRSIG